MLVNLTISEFLSETASVSPAPGGGSVAALAGALGAALSSMVCKLSTSKDSEATTAQIQTIARTSQELMSSLQTGIDKDTEAFNNVMAAFKLPKANAAEQQARSTAIQQAMKQAADEPWRTAVSCLAVMKAAADILKTGNKNAASDAAVSGFMAYAALNGAVYNVKINLKSIKDVEYVEKMKCQSSSLLIEAEQILSDFRLLANEIIG